MTEFVVLRDNLADTPRKEIVKIISYLWGRRFDLSVGDNIEIGLSYKIKLYRTSSTEFFFALMGVSPNDDTFTIQKVVEEITRDTP